MKLSRHVLSIVLVFCFSASLIVTRDEEARISSSAQAHIKQRHWYYAKSGQKTSHFNRSMTMKKLDAIATKTIRQGSVRPSKHGQGRYTYQYKFRIPIGRNTQGKKSYKLRVVTDSKKNIITAFPI